MRINLRMLSLVFTLSALCIGAVPAMTVAATPAKHSSQVRQLPSHVGKYKLINRNHVTFKKVPKAKQSKKALRKRVNAFKAYVRKTSHGRLTAISVTPSHRASGSQTSARVAYVHVDPASLKIKFIAARIQAWLYGGNAGFDLGGTPNPFHETDNIVASDEYRASNPLGYCSYVGVAGGQNDDNVLIIMHVFCLASYAGPLMYEVGAPVFLAESIEPLSLYLNPWPL